MAGQGISRANSNRKIRQDEYRELLSKQGHLQHVIDICDELNDLTKEMEPLDVQRKSKVIDTKLKLINKYCPDLKSVEMTGEGGNELTITVTNFGDKK